MSVSRPSSARPRQETTAEQEALRPPTAEELEAIERDRIDWAVLQGAAVEDAPELGGLLVLHASPISDLNYLAAIRWEAADFDANLAHVIEAMADRGLWPSLIECDSLTQPSDLAQRLRAADWIPVFSDRIMWTRRPAVVPHLEPRLRIEAVTPASALEAIRIETNAFGLMPQETGESAELLAEAVVEGTTRAFLVRLDGQAVASARLVSGPLVSGLHAIGVDSRQRRRGYGRLVTAVATRAGLATGHKLVWLSVLESNTPAMNLYRSLGFEPTFTWTRWLAPA